MFSLKINTVIKLYSVTVQKSVTQPVPKWPHDLKPSRRLFKMNLHLEALGRLAVSCIFHYSLLVLTIQVKHVLRLCSEIYFNEFSDWKSCY